MDDLISRQVAIDALWKALYDYEDKTEKQFLESEELNTDDWFRHRIFVQNMNDIDRQTILNLPSAQRWIPCSERLPDQNGKYLVVGRQKAINILKFDGGRWYGKWGVVAWMPLPEPYKGESE